MGKEKSEVTCVSSGFYSFPEKLVYPCCKLLVRAAGLPPRKRGRNVLVLIPQYLLVHVVLDIMCEVGV